MFSITRKQCSETDRIRYGVIGGTKMPRNMSGSVSFFDIRIRKMLDIRKVTVLYGFTTVYGPFVLTWVMAYDSIRSERGKFLSPIRSFANCTFRQLAKFVRKLANWRTSYSKNNFYRRISTSNSPI